MKTRTLVARFALVAAALTVGWWMSRTWPVEVNVVYDLSERPPLASMDVEFRQDDELVRRTEFRRLEERPRHTVRLRPGRYTVSLRMQPVVGERLESERAIEVERGTEQLVVRP